MIKVTMIADGGWPTGFEQVARGIGSALVATGDFEVVHRAIGYDGEKLLVPEYPYKILPVGSVEDPLGLETIADTIAEDAPDVLLIIQDIWNQSMYLSRLPDSLPTVGYYPVDAPNIKWDYAMAICTLTEAVTYTEFGATQSALAVRHLTDIVVGSHERAGQDVDAPVMGVTLPRPGGHLYLKSHKMRALQEPSNYTVIPHGVTAERMYPMDKKEARKAYGLPEDAFIVMNVGTNQFRKRLDLTVRAFADFAKDKEDAVLVIHCMGGDRGEGWDIPQLGQLYGIQDKLVGIHWARPFLTDDQLRVLYNCADVHINTSGGEGWGLTTVESALCGVAQLVPDWSATREIWGNHGMLLPVSDYRFEPRGLNTAHAIVDAKQAANRLDYLYHNKEALSGLAVNCLERALELPSWQEVGDRFAEVLKRAVAVHKEPVPTSFSEVRRGAETALTSELLTFPLRN